jgi:hypothetical protein
MFEYMAEFPRIIVTGPHRSGTTFIAHAIGYDTGKTVLDERNIGHSKVRHIPEVMEGRTECVLQAPYALPWAPILSDDDTAVVFCRRNPKDVERSIERSMTARGKSISVPGFSVEQAEALWWRVRPLVVHPLEVDYDRVVSHPLFVLPGGRKGWHHKQVDHSGVRYTERKWGGGDR